MKITAAVYVAAADTERRTISGRIVPFGAVGNTSVGPTIVEAGAVEIADRVPLLVSHDHDRPIGKLVASEVLDDGIVGTFRVAATKAGDDALVEASEGVREGLSVGLEVIDHEETDDGLVVKAARLVEVSLVTFPAFADARVASVAASDPLTPPGDEDTPAESEEPVDNTPTTPEPVVEVAAALPRVTVTAEEFPYGRPSVNHLSFFRDMVNANSDHEAKIRAERAQRMMVEAAQKSSDVASIIPPGYRPDLYVQEIPNYRPTADSFAHYPISDATPFKVPRFSKVTTSSISTPAEGTQPTQGAYAFDQVTVTPQSVYGMYQATREALDATNPALDGIIMRAIMEDYHLKVETYVTAQIVAGATAAASLPASGKTLAMMGQYAAFMTGRKAPAERVVVSPAVYQALVTEADQTGRPLNAYTGHMNADGRVGTAADAVDLGGLPVRMAWSLDAATKVDAIVARRSDAAVFESGFQMWRWIEKDGPAFIDFAAHSYLAAAVLQPLGVVKLPTAAGSSK